MVAGGGHTTEAPKNSPAQVRCKESVHVVLTVAARNGLLEVKAADIQNQSARLTAPASENAQTRLGPEFGSDDSENAAIVARASCTLKGTGALFGNHLAGCHHELGCA